MRKIALEEHFSNKLFEQFDQEAFRDRGFPVLTDPKRKEYLDHGFFAPVEEYRIPKMEENKVELQILSPDTQAVQYLTDPKRAVSMAKTINDLAREMVCQNPRHFRAFAVLPMQDPKAAAKELAFRVKEQGFVGGFVHGHTHFSYYDEEKYDPVWDKLEELDVPFYMHPSNPEADQIRMYEGYEELLGNTWNWGCVTATHILRMVFGGVFERHPRLKVVIGHMGEMLPYMLGRLDEGYEGRRIWEKGRISNPPSFYLKRNLYITTSGGYQPETMRCAVEALGADHMMFASDYPHFPMDQAARQVENSGLDQKELEQICYENALQLLKL